MVHVEHGYRPSQTKESTTVSRDRHLKAIPIRSALDLLTQPAVRAAASKDHVSGVHISSSELTEHGKAPGSGRINPKTAPRRP